MSANSIMAVSQGPVSQAGADNRLRWAALDSRNERLVTATDSTLTDMGRENQPAELRAAS